MVLELTEENNICDVRLAVLDKKSWRETFKTLVLSEYILTHAPESFAVDFRSEKDVLHQLTHFQHVDDLGYSIYYHSSFAKTSLQLYSGYIYISNSYAC